MIKTPGSRYTLAFLLLVQVLMLPIEGFVEARFSPAGPPPYPEHIVIATVVWGFFSVLLAVPFVRLWPVYPGSVPLRSVWRGLAGRHGGTPFVAMGQAFLAGFFFVALHLYHPTDLSYAVFALLVLNWLYVSLSIGAASVKARR